MQDDRNHGGRVRDVIDEGRGHGRNPQDDENGRCESNRLAVAGIAAEEGDGTLDVFSDERNDTHVLERMNEDKEASEKEQGGPFNVVQGFLEFMAIRGQEHDDSTNKCNP